MYLLTTTALLNTRRYLIGHCSLRLSFSYLHRSCLVATITYLTYLLLYHYLVMGSKSSKPNKTQARAVTNQQLSGPPAGSYPVYYSYVEPVRKLNPDVDCTVSCATIDLHKKIGEN